MKPNIGKTDRLIRLILGLVILGVGLKAGSWWGLIGLIPIATAAISWCPLYCPLNISTRKSKE